MKVKHPVSYARLPRSLHQVRTSRIPASRARAASLIFERLEEKQLLAHDTSADVSITGLLHNEADPCDVNADGKVSPLDALHVINDLSINGPRYVTDTAYAASALAKIESDSEMPNLDVTGDGKLTMFDALVVINELNAKQDENDLIRIRLEVTDDTGAPITSIGVDETFQLRAYVMDLRAAEQAEGVFSAYFDVTYTANVVNTVGSVLFTDDYQAARSGNTATAGLIDEAGAVGGLTALGPTERLFFVVQMESNFAGTVNFNADPAEGAFFETLLYGLDRVLNADEIEFIGDSVNVGEETLPIISIANVSVNEGDTGSGIL